MCGIAGIYKKDATASGEKFEQATRAMLNVIQSRGRDATGVLALFDEGETMLSRGTVPAGRFIAKGMIPAQVQDARTVLLHTRFATVGRRDDVRNAHPVSSGTMFAVHNGTVWNDDQIFKAFELPRLAEVDSEVIPAIVGAFGWDDAGRGLELLDGDAATAIVDTEHPNDLILARTEGTPLVYFENESLIIWGSTAATIEAGFRAIYGKKAALPMMERLAEFHLLRATDGEVVVIRYCNRVARWADRDWWKPSGKVTSTKTSKSAAKSSRKKKGKQHGGAALRSARASAQALGVWTQEDDAELDYLLSEGFSLDEALDEITGGASAPLLTLVGDDEDDWEWEDDVPVHGQLNRPISGSRRVGYPWDDDSYVEHFDAADLGGES